MVATATPVVVISPLGFSLTVRITRHHGKAADVPGQRAPVDCPQNDNSRKRREESIRRWCRRYLGIGAMKELHPTRAALYASLVNP